MLVVERFAITAGRESVWRWLVGGLDKKMCYDSAIWVGDG